jgi:hypothetical protein
MTLFPIAALVSMLAHQRQAAPPIPELRRLVKKHSRSPLVCPTPRHRRKPTRANHRQSLQSGEGRCHEPSKSRTHRQGPSDSRMSPDLLRGTGKSIGGDLDVNDEGSEQRRFEPMQSLHHGSIGYQPVRT